jgi:hypothetical protein
MKFPIAAIAALLASASVARAEIDHSKDAAWRQLVDEGLRAGIKVERGCFNPSDGAPYCSLNMTSPTVNGQYYVMSEFYDMDDHMYARSFCAYDARAIARKRHCYDPDTARVTEELFNTLHETWDILRTYNEPDTTNLFNQQQQSFGGYQSFEQRPASPPVASIPQTQSQTLKEWDVTFTNGNVMHRILLSGSNGTRQLLATQRNASGMITSSSTCNFTQTWSDCVTNDGTHYQLQPGTIAWLYGQIPCPSVSLCGR